MSAKQQGYRVGRTGYVSEFTLFMDKFLEEHPEVVENQHNGWHIFWDRNVDLGELKKAGEDSVPTKNYYYF